MTDFINANDRPNIQPEIFSLKYSKMMDFILYFTLHYIIYYILYFILKMVDISQAAETQFVSGLSTGSFSFDV